MAQAPALGGDAPPQVGFQRRPQLSPQEEVAQGQVIVAHADRAAAVIRRQLDAARQARDVVKSLCLSDKLSQIDVAGRSLRDRQSALQAAAQRGDAELSNHEFTILSVLRQRVDQLNSEANQCIGEDVAFIGQTQVVTEVDPNIANPWDDTTGYPTVPEPVAVPPPCVSCTQ
jgi:hypothetical protein